MSRSVILVLMSLAVAVPAAAQDGPQERSQDRSRPVDALNRESVEAMDRRFRTWDARANKAINSICRGCLGSAPRRGAQPSDPFAPLPGADEVPYPELETIE